MEHVISWQEQTRPRDAWFAEDKLQHLLASFAATGFAYGAVRATGIEHDGAVPLAVLAAAAAGAAKEIHDRGQSRAVSVRDLVWDAAGITLGIILVRQTRQ
jgi:uncharacterized protein YfiM (DUF2279 family)